MIHVLYNDFTTEGREPKLISKTIENHFRRHLKYNDDFDLNDTAREDKSMIARLVIRLNGVSITFVLVLFADFR